MTSTGIHQPALNRSIIITSVHRPWVMPSGLLMADAVALTMAAALAFLLKWHGDKGLDPQAYLHALPLLLGVGAFIYGGRGLYPGLGLSSAEELRRLTHGTTLIFIAAMALTFVAKSGHEWSRQILLMTWLGALIAVPLGRAGVRRLLCRHRWWAIPCMIIGAGATGREVARRLSAQPWLGLRPVVFISDDPASAVATNTALPIEGPILIAAERWAAAGVHNAILAMPGLPPPRLAGLLDALGMHVGHIHIAPALPGSPDVIAETQEFAGVLVLEVKHNLLRWRARAIKRIMDFLLIVAAVALLWWVGVAIALAVKLTSPGPIFYGQRRIGRGGHSFIAWKFRSMVRDADAVLEQYLTAHPQLRAEWQRDRKLRNDPRVTWIGRILRRTSLDELPQLWNVVRGDMSLVGPRPIVYDEIANYGERFQLYAKVRPGLSGLWQVSGRNDTTYAERVSLDGYYVRNWSVWLDLVIIARTVRVVVLGKGAY